MMKMIVFAMLSIAQPVLAASANPCEGKTIFPVTHSGTFEQSLQWFENSGGKAEDIVLVDSIATITSQFTARPFPTDFTYNKKVRNAMAFKFGVSSQCQLHASRYEYGLKDEPGKGVHHLLAAKGNEVYSAGAILFFHDGEKIEKVVVANRSSQFCPSFESLSVVQSLLENMGVPSDKILLLDEPNDVCGAE